MVSNKIRFFILTGEPGVGKTTLTKKVSSLLAEKGVKISGFYTEEVRNNGTREGFDVVTLTGERGPLARVSSLLDKPTKFNVGKYGVLIREFENLALPCLNTCNGLLVIDEIGKMEFFSVPFKTKIKEIFFCNKNSIVFATIPLKKVEPLIENIENHPDAKVWTVTRENRNTVHEEILQEMNNTLEFN